MDKKTFAFKLAEKRENATDKKKWKARDGVTVASCSLFDPENLEWAYYRTPGKDDGYYC